MSDGQHEGWHETRDRKYPLKPKPKKKENKLNIDWNAPVPKPVLEKEEPVAVLIPVKDINLMRKLSGMVAEGELVALMVEAMKAAGFVDLLDNPKSDTIRLDIMLSWVKENKREQRTN